MDIYNDDCFNIFPKIEDKSINLFLLDLPYANKKFGNCTACAWDTPIDLEKMWVEIKRTMKPNGIIVFFCNTKFGYALINSNPKWFKYDLIWEKSRKVGFLSANKMPLRKHENIYIFKDQQGNYTPQKTEGHKPYIDKRNQPNAKGYYREDGTLYAPKPQNNEGKQHPTSILPEFEETHENIYIFNNKEDDIEIVRNLELRKYAEKVKNYIDKGMKEIEREFGGRQVEHFFYIKSSQFGLPNKKNYDKLTKLYDLNDMEGFLKFDDMKELEELETYNPQKTEGTPYSCKQGDQTNIYGIEDKEKVITENKGDRHPTSILPEFEETHENIYIFKDQQGTYNPQKSEGHTTRIRSHNKNANCNIIYGDDVKIQPLDTTDKRHPSSILPEFEETHENIYIFKDKQGTYNPQKTEREKDYKHSGKRSSEEHYGNVLECKKEYKKEDGMHPTSILPEFETTILKYNNPHKTIHRTQKPVDLLEWLIKTYTNEDDVVMDFCMGSGSCGVACHNTKRKFIGVERDEDIFKLAEKRIDEHVK